MVKKYQLEVEKDKMYIRNRMYMQIKKNKHGYFKDINGEFIEKQKGFCDGCERTDIPVRALDDAFLSDHICPSCAADFTACRILLSMYYGK